MPKKTWVNVGGEFKEVKNVWQNIQGLWKQRVVPKGFIAGMWRDFMQYLLNIFNSGGTPITTLSPINGSGQVTIGADVIRLDKTGSGAIASGVVTVDMIDVTDYDTLYVEWETAFGPIHASNYIGLGITTRAKEDSGVLNVNYMTATEIMQSNNTRTVRSLDISSLSGEFNIVVFTRVVSSATVMNAKVFRIWAE